MTKLVYSGLLDGPDPTPEEFELWIEEAMKGFSDEQKRLLDEKYAKCHAAHREAQKKYGKGNFGWSYDLETDTPKVILLDKPITIKHK